MLYDHVKYIVTDSIGYITICRPEVLNALNLKTIEELYSIFSEIMGDETVEAVIITGEGTSFASGVDIEEMHQFSPLEGRNLAMKGHALMNLMEALEKPIIAAINGYALGGGCELAMACDIRIASETAHLGHPEVGLGIIPGFGGTQRLPRLVGPGMGKYLIMTGEVITASEALRIGLIEKIVPPEELIPFARKTASRILTAAPIAVGVAKTVINTGYNLDLKTAGSLETEAFTIPFSSEDKTEGMGAFLEKRKPKFNKR